MDDDGLIYKLLDIKYPEAAPKGIHYNCLKPYCSETVLPAATHSVPQPPRDALPGFTALSGSLPLCFGQSVANQIPGPARLSIPVLRRPTGRVSCGSPAQAQGSTSSTVPLFVGPSITRSGCIVRKPQRLLL